MIDSGWQLFPMQLLHIITLGGYIYVLVSWISILKKSKEDRIHRGKRSTYPDDPPGCLPVPSSPIPRRGSKEIAVAAEESGFNIRGAEIVDPLNYEEMDEMVQLLCEIRKIKV